LRVKTTALVLAITVATLPVARAANDDSGEPAAPGLSQTAPPGSPTLSKQEIAARYRGLDPGSVKDSPIEGLYEVSVGNRVSYVTKDGRFQIRGDVVEVATQTNLTEQRRAKNRAALLAAIDPSTEIVFSPPNGVVKHRITVFTDVDCGFCRQLHRDIATVNSLGIEVRYVAYPRTGPNTESWSRAVGVWCAADRNTALTDAKRGARVAEVPGCTAPVAAEYELGRRIGVTGTPAVYSESGVELGGYLPPGDLLTALEHLPVARD